MSSKIEDMRDLSESVKDLAGYKMVNGRRCVEKGKSLAAVCGATIMIICFGLNPLRANFFRGNLNIYLHFVSFLHIDTTQVVEILPQIRQEPTYFR